MSRCLDSVPRTPIILIIVWTMAASVLGPTTSLATDLIWDGGSGGLGGAFNGLGNWNDNFQFPTAGDTATFNISSTYTVTFTANAASDALTVSAGTVDFRSDSAAVRTYNLTTGASDMLVNGNATLNVGFTGLPVNITVGDTLWTGIGGAGSGTIVVSGSGSGLTALGSTSIADSGNTGTLRYANGAQGILAGLGLAFSGNSLTRGNLEVISDADLDVGTLQIGINTSSSSTGMVTVSGSGSTLEMIGASTLTMGSAAGNIGKLNVDSLGLFSTGTGAVTINATGEVNIGGGPDLGGSLILNGDTIVDGGSITVANSGGLNLNPGRTLTLQNGAQLDFVGGGFQLYDGATCNINSGADLISGVFNFGDSGTSVTLVVDGLGSSLQTVGASGWGITGGTADVTIRNGAIASVGQIKLGALSGSGTINVQSGATMTSSNLLVGSEDFAGTGTINLDGAGSTLTQTGASILTVGDPSFGAATININNSGTFSTGTGAVTVDATGEINIGGGTLNLNGDTTVDGGTITRTSGSLNLASGKTLTAQNGAQINLGASATLQGVTTWIIKTGSDLIATSGNFNIGQDGPTTLVVDGAGSSLQVAGTSFWADSGWMANVTIRNGASATTSALQLAGSAFANSVGALNVESGATMITGNLAVAQIFGPALATGTIVVDGVGTVLAQSGVSTLTLGHASLGTATLNITNSGTFSTGTGAVTVNATGDINIGGGTLNLNGDTLVDGGTITRMSGTLNLASGRTLTAQNGAQINLGSFIDLGGGTTTWDVNSGADLIGTDILSIGTTADATTTVTVDGPGSSLQKGTSSASGTFWGYGGGTANVTIRNGATATIGIIGLASSTTDGTTGSIAIQSGGAMTAGNLLITNAGGANTTGILSVDGAGSTLTQTGASLLTLGHATSGTAEINIGTTASGGEFHTGTGLFTVNHTGTVTIGSGPNTGWLNARGDIMIDGGALTVGSGSSFTLAAGRTITVTNGGSATWADAIGVFNNTWNVNGAGSQLEFDGVSFTGGAPLNLSNGGLLLSQRFIDFSGATLSVDGPGTNLTANGLSGGWWGFSGSTATVTFSNNASGTVLGELRIVGHATSGSAANVTVQSGASLTLGSLLLNTQGGSTTGTLTVTGSDSSVTVNGGLSIGHTSSGTATLNVNNDSLFTVGTGGSTTINATGVVNLASGAVFDARGPINLNGGAFNFLGGTLHADTFNGNLVNQGGTLAPGHSAGNTTIVGNYTQQAAAALEIEIGGTTPGGEHDLVGVTGNAVLDGDLQLHLIDGFMPSPTDTFTVLNATNIFGLFDNVLTGQRLNTIDGIGSFLVHYGAGSAFDDNQVVLSAFAAEALPGDFNADGVVDTADYVVWRKGIPPNNTPADYDTWRTHFGESNSGAGGNDNMSVPEPASFIILLLTTCQAALSLCRRVV